MNTFHRRCAYAFLSVSLGVAASLALSTEHASRAEESAPRQTAMQKYMRRKMDASSEILEGIVMENSALIHDGGKVLLEMSKAEKFQVLTDKEYRLHNRQFREAVDRLLAAADSEGYDKAALAWFDVTISCVDCHDHVRKSAATADPAKEPAGAKEPADKK